jgi:hypothetical protein
MKPLTRDELYSLEDYAEARPRFRAEILKHKKNRQVEIGPHATLYFARFSTRCRRCCASSAYSRRAASRRS